MSECSGSCGSCSSCGSCGEDKLTKKMALISRKILVLSGKGGVGKSSVAATVALQLAASGRKVGLLDCDFHGPSLPTILGVTHKKLDYSEENGIIPLPLGNLKFLSVGLLMDDPDQAIVWRGPAKMGVIKQLHGFVDQILHHPVIYRGGKHPGILLQPGVMSRGEVQLWEHR